MVNRLRATSVLLLVAFALIGTSTAIAAEPSHPRERPERGQRVTPLREAAVTEPDITAGGMEILSARWWIDSFDYINLVGEVRNELGTRRQFVELAVTIYDAADNQIGAESGYLDVDQLSFGGTSPFLVFFEAPPGAHHILDPARIGLRTAGPARWGASGHPRHATRRVRVRPLSRNDLQRGD